MKTDVGTVAWKELTEIRRGPAKGGNRSLLGMIVITLFVSVVIPYTSGPGVGGIAVLMIGALVAGVWVLTTVPDAFAGERDRHTLETLLATRLSARAILAGKAIAGIVCASALGMLATVLAIIAGNVGGVIHHDQTGVDIPFVDAGIGLVVVVATTILLTNLGILVALRASSALNAQRVLGMSLAGLVLLASIGIPALPEGMQTDLRDLGDQIASLGPAAIVAIVLVALVALNVGLASITLARFTRPALTGR